MSEYEESDRRDRADEYRESHYDRSPSPERERNYDRNRSLSPRRDQDEREEENNTNKDSGNGGSSDHNLELPPIDPEEEAAARNEGTNIFVTGLSKSVTESELSQIFSKFGAVERANIMSDPHTRESRGFGFVNMVDVESADAAIAELNGQVISGKALNLEKAKRKRPRTPTPGKYFGPPKPRRVGGRGPPRYDDRYADRDRRDFRPRYERRPSFDDSYRRPRFEDRDRYYRGGDRYPSRYDERDRDPREYRDRYAPPPRDYRERDRYRDERPPRDDRPLRDERPPRDDRPLRDDRAPPRDDRGYRDERDRYPPPESYRDREDYRA